MSANGLDSYTMHVVDAESAPTLESIDEELGAGPPVELRALDPEGTVTLIGMCSHAVGFGATAIDQLWGVRHFRRQCRAR